jgi:hypothetical protein
LSGCPISTLAATTACSQLRVLHARECDGLTECNNLMGWGALEELDLSRCKNLCKLGRQTVEAEALAVLTGTFAEEASVPTTAHSSTSGTTQTRTAFAKLRRLVLCECPRLQSISTVAGCTSLRSLRMRRCPSLARGSLLSLRECAALKDVDLSYCTSLDNSDISMAVGRRTCHGTRHAASSPVSAASLPPPPPSNTCTSSPRNPTPHHFAYGKRTRDQGGEREKAGEGKRERRGGQDDPEGGDQGGNLECEATARSCEHSNGAGGSGSSGRSDGGATTGITGTSSTSTSSTASSCTSATPFGTSLQSLDISSCTSITDALASGLGVCSQLLQLKLCNASDVVGLNKLLKLSPRTRLCLTVLRR